MVWRVHNSRSGRFFAQRSRNGIAVQGIFVQPVDAAVRFDGGVFPCRSVTTFAPVRNTPTLVRASLHVPRMPKPATTFCAYSEAG
jgi:hypothetical protein